MSAPSSKAWAKAAPGLFMVESSTSAWTAALLSLLITEGSMWFKFQIRQRLTWHPVLKTEETDLHYLSKSISNLHRDRLQDILQIYLIGLLILKWLYTLRLCSTLACDGWVQNQNLCDWVDTIPRVTKPWNPSNFLEETFYFSLQSKGYLGEKIDYLYSLSWCHVFINYWMILSQLILMLNIFESSYLGDHLLTTFPNTGCCFSFNSKSAESWAALSRFLCCQLWQQPITAPGISFSKFPRLLGSNALSSLQCLCNS